MSNIYPNLCANCNEYVRKVLTENLLVWIVVRQRQLYYESGFISFISERQEYFENNLMWQLLENRRKTACI